VAVWVTKRYDDPIDVYADPVVDDAPVAFRWRGTRYEVDQRLDSWREAGQWWATAEATEREFFRVLARPSGTMSSGEVDADGFLRTNGAVFDVYRDRIRGVWRLARIWD
jgi:Family of unknown function (DUF6504)